eukprot:6458826-Amphidinium_carterae.1
MGEESSVLVDEHAQPLQIWIRLPGRLAFLATLAHFVFQELPTDIYSLVLAAMPKCATLPWIVVASAMGFWHGLATILPGGACLVSSCCEEAWGESFSTTYAIVRAELESEYNIIVETPHSPSCTLLGLTANACQNLTGNVSDALMEHAVVPDKAMVGFVLEAGACQDLSDSCWQTTNGSFAHVQWGSKLEYTEGQTVCSSSAREENITVAWSTECSSTAPYGLRLRASWVDGTDSEASNLCSSTATPT